MARWAVVAIAALLASSCDWLGDRFQTCHDMRVELVNSEQTLSAVHIAGPDEGFTPDTLLDSGATRIRTICVDRGNRVKFRAADRSGQVLGTIYCVVGRASYEGMTTHVVWTLQGFLCEAW